MICLKEKCRGSLSARDLLRMHSDAVGRSLGAAETNSAVTAAASHRPTFSLCAVHHRRATTGRPYSIFVCRLQKNRPPEFPAGGLFTLFYFFKYFFSASKVSSLMSCSTRQASSSATLSLTPTCFKSAVSTWCRS